MQQEPVRTRPTGAYRRVSASTSPSGLGTQTGPTSVPMALPTPDDPRCAVRLVLDRVADKWTALVVAVLSNGPARYGELRRAVAGISEKMLAQTLRGLERDGLVDRHVIPASPIRVEYELTDLGRTLVPALSPLVAWAAQHGPDMVTAQDRYDSRQSSHQR